MRPKGSLGFPSAKRKTTEVFHGRSLFPTAPFLGFADALEGQIQIFFVTLGG